MNEISSIKRIIIAGTRTFTDYEFLEIRVKSVITSIIKECGTAISFEFISGGANGADKVGERFARRYNYSPTIFNAEWDKFGKAAGIFRNSKMAEYASCESGYLIAFWDGESRGTRQMIDVALKYGLEVHVYNYASQKIYKTDTKGK